MGKSVKPDEPNEKGQLAPAWPESLARECRYHGDLFLGHETPAIAELSGRSRRDTNRLRERGGLEDERLTEVETIARYLYAGRARGFSFARRAALVQPIADALGADFAQRLPVVQDLDVVAAVAAAIKEGGEAASTALESLPDGITDSEADRIVTASEQTVLAHQQLIVAVRARVKKS